MKHEATSQTKPVSKRAAHTASWRLTPTARKTLLVLHAVTGIGWMGVDIALLVLLIAARTTNDPILVVSGFNAIRMIVPIAVPPLSLGILVTGLILGLGTRWGLVRYWWVLVKQRKMIRCRGIASSSRRNAVARAVPLPVLFVKVHKEAAPAPW